MTLVLALVLLVWLAFLGRTILNLLLIPRLRPVQPRGTFVSVIIPARDEERTIERTVRALLAQTHQALEVIVVDDRSTDRTGEILRAIDGVVVIDGEEPPEGWLGKPWALHQGSRRARGELLFFIDADIIYAPDAVGAAVARIEESGVAMLTLFPRMEMHGFWEHLAMPMLALTGFTFLPTWLGNRTRIPLLGIGGGTGNLIRRTDYDALGGHESLKDSVVDDVALARLVRRSGRRTEIVRADDGLVSLRMYHGRREIVEGFTKNMFAVMLRSYVLSVLNAILMAVLHLLPYALALAGNRLAIASVAIITLIRLILFRSLRYRLDNALLGHPLMIAFWSWVFLRSIWYTGIRRRLDWRGRTYDARQTRFGADR
ncbi:MAG TPA: glycosyltransferase family 2 protein [Thermoanaerobaculia bacterium]|nr:glycosyltransferase family 2 protein [Thermoanaerobaculia bacterium]